MQRAGARKRCLTSKAAQQAADSSLAAAPRCEHFGAEQGGAVNYANISVRARTIQCAPANISVRHCEHFGTDVRTFRYRPANISVPLRNLQPKQDKA